MFGNLKGWIFSAPLVLITILLFFFAGKADPRSAPTGKLALALKPAKLSVDPRSLVPLGTGTEDGGKLLRAIVDKYKEDGYKYKFKKFGEAKPADKPKLAEEYKPFCDQLVEAMNCSSFASLFTPQDMVVYGMKPYCAELLDTGLGVGEMGMFYVGKDAKGKVRDAALGRKYIEAAFRLGAVMYEDRQVYKEYREGCALLRQAGFQMKYIETDAAKKQQFQSLYEDVDKTAKPENEIFEIFRMVPADNDVMREPGDTFEIALKSEEPMWQTEAIMRLGRMKFGYASYADQKAAPGVIDEISKRPNLKPNVKVAVDRAKNATMGDFQKIDGY
jgi:hypothetical protein